jgi:hypothetical protein
MEPIQLKTVLKTNNKIDMARILVCIVALTKNITLSKSEILVLSHFLGQGYNQYTKEQLIENKILKNKAALDNTVSKLRKVGMIKNKGFGECLCDDLNFPLSDVALFKILLDNR